VTASVLPSGQQVYIVHCRPLHLEGVHKFEPSILYDMTPLTYEFGTQMVKKCTVHAKNFICRLSRSIFSHFGTILSWNLRHSRKLQKKHETLYFGGSWSFKVIDVDTIKKLVTSACYDKQYIYQYAYLQQFFYSKQANSGKITTFRGIAVFDACLRRSLEFRGSGSGLLKFAFNAESFM